MVWKGAQQCLDGKKVLNKTILMDTPQHKSIEELVEKASNREEWNLMCNMICPRRKKKIHRLGDGEISLVPEPAEERRVRTRHGSPRGVCAAAARAQPRLHSLRDRYFTTPAWRGIQRDVVIVGRKVPPTAD